MKPIRFVMLAVGLAGLFAMPLVVRGQGILDAARLAAIQQRCTELQVSIDQVQRRDLVARTDQGREYENVVKQLEAFNQRLRHNDQPSGQFDAPLADFKATLAGFRDAYLRYDNKMSALRRVDCQTKPDAFATALEEAKVLRAEVAREVTKAAEATARYRQAAVDLQATLGAAQ